MVPADGCLRGQQGWWLVLKGVHHLFDPQTQTNVSMSTAAKEMWTGARRSDAAHLRLHRPLLHAVFFRAAVRGRFWNVLSVYKLEDNRQTVVHVRTKTLDVTSVRVE